MVRIGKTFTFEAAHRLPNHEGKCRGIHGHSYKLEVQLEGPDWSEIDLRDGQPDEGMLVDFGQLSRWWKNLEPLFDHCLILDAKDPLVETLNGTAVDRNMTFAKISEMPFVPTAENLARWFVDDVRSWFNNKFVITTRLWETASSYAEAVG